MWDTVYTQKGVSVGTSVPLPSRIEIKEARCDKRNAGKSGDVKAKERRKNRSREEKKRCKRRNLV